MATKNQWRFNLKGARRVAQRTPVITEDLVLATFYHGEGLNSRGTLVALNASDGREIWRFDAEDTLNEPVVDRDGFIYTTCFNGWVYKLNREGKIVWQVRQASSSIWKPLLVRDLLVYAEIAGRAKNTWAIAISDGSLQWQYEHGGHSYSLAGSGDRIVYSTIKGSFDNKEIVLQCLDTQTGKPIWQTDSQQYLFNPIIDRQVIYIGSRGYVAAFCLQTGNLLTRYDLEAGVAVKMSPLITNDAVIFCTEGEILRLSKVNREISLTLNWHFAAGSEIKANLLQDNEGLLVIVESGELVRIDLEKGELIQKQKLSGFKRGFGMAMYHRNLIMAVSRYCVCLNIDHFFIEH